MKNNNDIIERIKSVMASVEDDFNIIVNDKGFMERHEVLFRESSVYAHQRNMAMGIASVEDYRARYIALLNCIVDYMDHLD